MISAAKEKERSRFLERALRKIIDCCAPERVILFGSEATGTADEESDIDILIVRETNQRPVDRRIEVKRLLRDRSRPFAISPLVYTPEEWRLRIAQQDPFIQEVVEEGKVLYG